MQQILRPILPPMRSSAKRKAISNGRIKMSSGKPLAGLPSASSMWRICATLVTALSRVILLTLKARDVGKPSRLCWQSAIELASNSIDIDSPFGTDSRYSQLRSYNRPAENWTCPFDSGNNASAVTCRTATTATRSIKSATARRQNPPRRNSTLSVRSGKFKPEYVILRSREPASASAAQSRCCPGSFDLTSRRSERQQKTLRLHFATRLRRAASRYAARAVPLLVTRETFRQLTRGERH